MVIKGGEILLKIINDLCTKRHINQSELARNVGVSAAFINRVVNGKKQPSLKTAQKIAQFFHVSVDYLLKAERIKGNAKPEATNATKRV